MNPNPNQKNRTVLITGAADRLGLEMAKECLDLGYHAIIHYRTSVKPALSLLGRDERVTFIQADLAESPEMPEMLMDDILGLPMPPLEGLINNAAVFQPGDMSDPKLFCDTLTINALVPLRLAAEFAKAADTGWIVNVTDAHTRPKSRKYQNYRVSKQFLDEITGQLAFLYAPSIRVNAIAPGAILPSSEESAQQFEDLSRSIPLRKTGHTGHIRQALKFLIENDYVTGAIIPVDGGWHL
jgi:NAD(P)-dependent dehydrogenase (short-subunit alcohol dehydrogenase family)